MFRAGPPKRDADTRRLRAGIVASVVLHAAGGVLIAWGPVGGKPADGFGELVTEARQEREEEIRPGIEQSRAMTLTWLGFSDPTPHSAEQSVTEQAAMSPAPAPMPTDPSPPTLSGAPTSVAAEDTVEPPAAAPEPEPITEQVLAAADAGETIEGEATEAEAEQAVAVAATESVDEPTAEPADKPSPDSAQTAAAAASDEPAPEQPIEPKLSGDAPGVQADKQAQATSTKPVAKVEPGKPAAAEGLDIRTVRPKWTTLTRLTAAPRNPVAVVKFGKSGRVIHAALLHSTGVADVDGPLVDSLYLWSAKGEALEALGPERDAGVELTFEVLINRNKR